MTWEWRRACTPPYKVQRDCERRRPGLGPGNGGELARPLIKFREIAREEGLDWDLGMEESLHAPL